MKTRVLVGRNIRRLRVARQLPQEALGVAAGIEPSYVGRLERGEENVGVDLLEKLAVALGIEVGLLFTQPSGDLLPGLRAGRKPKASRPQPVSEATTANKAAPAVAADPGPASRED